MSDVNCRIAACTVKMCDLTIFLHKYVNGFPEMIIYKQIGTPGKLDYRARKKVMLAFGNYNSSKIYLTLYSYYKSKEKLRNLYCSLLDVQFYIA